MARRGFLAEIQHQVKVSARQAEVAQRAAAREHNAAVRRAEQARTQAARAQAQASRAAEADRKRAEAEARRLHLEARAAEVEQMNADLARVYEEIDSLLAATLAVDDFVDLEQLRQIAQHPPFDRADLEAAIPAPPPIQAPQEPTFVPPPPPSGIRGVFGKKAHADGVAAAQLAHQAAVDAWRAQMAQLPARQDAQMQQHAEQERARQAALAAERARYDSQCAAREADAAAANEALSELIAGLDYGTKDAVEEYVSIVLSNSVYPESFPVEYDFEFDGPGAELGLRALIPAPDTLPAIKAHKHVKASDEITSTELPQKQRKDRYATAVHHVALRSMHEIFEADRRGLIRSISLELGTNTIDPATGQPIYVPFVAVATTRETFESIDLAAVVPSATLGHLGATVSKDPHGLTPIDPSGIRRT